MPLPDLTIDTNVLLHSCNSIEPRCAHSVALLTNLLKGSASLAIDPGFSVVSAQNRSLIGGEYLEKLVPGSLPNAVIAHLASSGRIMECTTTVASQLSKKLNQLIANRRDRTFVRVCTNSAGKTLVSHDFEDFTLPKRKAIGKLFGITIVEAEGCAGKI